MLFSRILLASSIALCSAGAAQAGDVELVARYGEDGGDIRGAGLALRLGDLWSKERGQWKFRLRPEFEFNRFQFDSNRFHTSDSLPGRPTNLNEGAAVAHLRLQRSNGRFGPYAEVGFGLAALNHVGLGGKDYSTGFQFTERIGAGLTFPHGWSVGWQYAHYSNASIKTPNDGIDMQQIVIGVSF